MVSARTFPESVEAAYMASDKNVEPRDRPVISEFCHLLEKSKQLFNGLRYVSYWLINSCLIAWMLNNLLYTCLNYEALNDSHISLLGIFLNMVMHNGKRILAEHLMCTLDYGNFSSSIVKNLMSYMDLNVGKLARWHQKLVNCIIIISKVFYILTDL